MVRDISESPFELPAGTEPERIYHYTDTRGLLGIFQNKSLWASDVWFMNDAREAMYGVDVMERVLKSLVTHPGIECQVHDKATDLIRRVRERQDFLRSYIACLTKKGDQLSQWRAYGRPRGFSIGFDRQKVQGLCPIAPASGKPTYRNVNYDVTVQDNMMKMWFQTALNGLGANATTDEIDRAARGFLSQALQEAPAFKDYAFREEEEVRLQIYYPLATRDILKFRDGAMGVTPYVEINLKDPGTAQMTVVREVIIGPQANQKESMRAVKQLVVWHGLPDVEVRLSDIPLRF